MTIDPTVNLRNNFEFSDNNSDDKLSARDYKMSKKYAQRFTHILNEMIIFHVRAR